MTSKRVTRYARSADGESIAYQVVGEGPFDLVYVPGFVSNVEVFWTEPAIARFYERLASFSRLILFDKRGTGLSDPLRGLQTLEERIEDVLAVMDAAGSEQAAVVGLSEGSAMAAVLAGTHPERVTHLVLCGSIVGGDAEDHPAGARWSKLARHRIAKVSATWGSGATLRLVAPTAPVTDEQLGRLELAGASPGMAQALLDMWLRIDLRPVLHSIGAPTLVLHRTEEIFPIEVARAIAEGIPGARLVELPGRDHAPWFGNADAYLAEIEEFLTGTRAASQADRVLATVLVTDIVGSTERAAALGDGTWRGDGFLATFDGPARGIRCAQGILAGAREQLGLEVRAGVHTGEVDLVDGDVRGVAVHIAARVGALAGPGEVLVSSTVRDLVIGSNLDFEERERTQLKGVPGEWSLFSVAGFG